MWIAQKVSVLFILLMCAVSLQAQTDFQFLAKSNIKEISEGAVFEVSYQINLNNYDNFKAPKFKDFKIVGGPNRSQQTTIVNGQVSSNTSIGYTLLALKKGSYTIQPGQIKSGNSWYKSNAIKIKVLDKKETPNVEGLSDENIIVRIELSADSVYVGQQVIVDYVQYSNVQTSGTSVISQPDFSDFYVEHPRLFPRSSQRMMINGEPYESKILYRAAIFPQFPGVYDLDKVVANVRILLEGGSRSAFSFFRPSKTVSIGSEKVSLVVTSIPSEEPIGFTGGVGQYRITPSVNRAQVKQNQAISLRIRMKGNGDPKKLKAPEITMPEHVELYEPKLIKDDLTEVQGEILSTRTYEYILVPSDIGELNLDFDLSYFDPELADFVPVKYAPLKINISEGAATDADSESILYDQTVESDDDPKNTYWRWGIPLVALMSLLGVGWFIKSKNNNKPKIIEEINWEERAREYLSSAQENIHNNNGSEFYESIRNGIYGYVAQKINLPISELTQEKAINKLKSEGVDQSLIEEVEQIIQKSEMALFAGQNKETDRQAMYDQAVSLLGKLERLYVSPSCL